MLTQVSNNYSALQMRAVTLKQHQQQSTSTLTENTQQYEVVLVKRSTLINLVLQLWYYLIFIYGFISVVLVFNFD